MNKNIILIGPMGSGKTSVGRRLSCVLHKDFFDSDFEVVSRTGVSIEHIFDVEDEEGFRKRETKVLQDLVKIPNLVIATGGGIVVREENLQIMQNGIVVYLTATIDVLLQRCLKSKSRPLINNADDKRQTITDIFNARKELYESAADIIVDVSGKRLYSIINEIKEKITNLQ